jgi:hypothetical protein
MRVWSSDSSASLRRPTKSSPSRNSSTTSPQPISLKGRW